MKEEWEKSETNSQNKICCTLCSQLHGEKMCTFKFLPFENEAKYLGMNLGVRLKLKSYIKKEKRRTRNKNKKSIMVDRTKVTNDYRQ
jgi:hypothetical protein